MKNTAFEAQIKSSLEHLEVGYEPASWDLLRQKMDRILVEEEPAPVSEVDKAVFHKLQHMEMPYEPASWDLLATRVAQAARLRRRIWIGKVAEAAIFLLLLINMDGLLNMGDASRDRSRHRSNSNRPQVEAPVKNHRQRQYATVSGQQNENSSLSVLSSSESFSENMFPTGTVGVVNDPASDLNKVFASNPPSPTGSNAATPADIYWHTLASFAALNMRDANVAPSAGVFRTPYFPVKPARSSKMYAATFATYNHNFIKTGNDNRSANGYGGGIAIGYRQGKWAVEAGLTYNQANYSPKKEVEIYAGNLQDGYLGTYASQITADVFSIPVKTTRRFAQMGHTSVHGVAGVTANVSVQKSYQYRTVSYGSGPSAQPVQGQQSEPQLTRKGTGLLEENGKLSGNFYATADAGIRIQRPVGKRFAAFVEPVYHQSLGQSGIGPKSNRINTFSVNAGVVASL